ncbi:MAG TPA: hypothetical protein VIH90_08265 [Candidatus Saccharimonadales bacterium]
MSATRSIDIAPRLIEVNFRDVPEGTLEDTIDSIAQSREDPQAPSFGAYVIRQAGFKVARGIINRFNQGPDRQRVRKGVFSSQLSILHYDGTGVCGFTAHVTKRGLVKGVVLTGAEVHDYSQVNEALTRQLLDESTLPAGENPPITLSPDSRPLMTTLGVDDVLVFDHTQLHGFKSLNGDRLSKALY